MNIVYAVLVAVYGVVIGSFLNVCIFRIPRNESIVFGRSSCTQCGEHIKGYDLIPLLSYILLGGRCRSCKGKISMQYPFVEFTNGAAWLCIYLKFGMTINTLFYCILASLLIVISYIDLQHRMIPDSLVLITFSIAVIFAIFGRDISILDRFIGIFVASVPLLVLALATNGGFGGGDIKLLAAVGAFVGWKLVLLGLFIGIVFGAVVSLILVITGIKGRKDFIPFGPFLSVGFYIVILGGYPLINWYLSLL